jgi:hypothetical protein
VRKATIFRSVSELPTIRSDLLAGLSIVTGVLLHEYLVASIVVLMLSGGTALEAYAPRHASALLGHWQSACLRLLTSAKTIR